ncbi:hypothetical protein TorRG33x02_153620 [Trema orientale]|uniref:Uncharacterized protein n=1 Tax=Trema orientale TaxID=63057 RepID=A0A2P5ETK5_TREOI|nr:hypothetical protein TorRG33x02_153620 [Trema orientale]
MGLPVLSSCLTDRRSTLALLSSFSTEIHLISSLTLFPIGVKYAIARATSGAKSKGNTRQLWCTPYSRYPNKKRFHVLDTLHRNLLNKKHN